MSKTKHHGKRQGKPANNQGTKRRGPGYEYWGKEAYMGADKEKIVTNRRVRAKKEITEQVKEKE